MHLRIIGGTLRNRLVKAPKGSQTRPSLAIVRKAVFDILQHAIEGCDFLDLFAGTGAMGIEAISRGAHHATFVERDRHAMKCIEENSRNFHIDQQCTLLRSDALTALKKLRNHRTFDIVYIDPPYGAAAHKELLPKILISLEAEQLLKPQAIVFVEEGAPPTLQTGTPQLNTLRLINSRTFSQSVLHQFRKSVLPNSPFST